MNQRKWPVGAAIVAVLGAGAAAGGVLGWVTMSGGFTRVTNQWIAFVGIPMAGAAAATLTWAALARFSKNRADLRDGEATAPGGFGELAVWVVPALVFALAIVCAVLVPMTMGLEQARRASRFVKPDDLKQPVAPPNGSLDNLRAFANKSALGTKVQEYLFGVSGGFDGMAVFLRERIGGTHAEEALRGLRTVGYPDAPAGDGRGETIYVIVPRGTEQKARSYLIDLQKIKDDLQDQLNKDPDNAYLRGWIAPFSAVVDRIELRIDQPESESVKKLLQLLQKVQRQPDELTEWDPKLEDQWRTFTKQLVATWKTIEENDADLMLGILSTAIHEVGVQVRAAKTHEDVRDNLKPVLSRMLTSVKAHETKHEKSAPTKVLAVDLRAREFGHALENALADLDGKALPHPEQARPNGAYGAGSVENFWEFKTDIEPLVVAKFDLDKDFGKLPVTDASGTSPLLDRCRARWRAMFCEGEIPMYHRTRPGHTKDVALQAATAVVVRELRKFAGTRGEHYQKIHGEVLAARPGSPDEQRFKTSRWAKDQTDKISSPFASHPLLAKDLAGVEQLVKSNGFRTEFLKNKDSKDGKSPYEGPEAYEINLAVKEQLDYADDYAKIGLEIGLKDGDPNMDKDISEQQIDRIATWYDVFERGVGQGGFNPFRKLKEARTGYPKDPTKPGGVMFGKLTNLSAGKLDMILNHPDYAFPTTTAASVASGGTGPGSGAKDALPIPH